MSIYSSYLTNLFFDQDYSTNTELNNQTKLEKIVSPTFKNLEFDTSFFSSTRKVHKSSKSNLKVFEEILKPSKQSKKSSLSQPSVHFNSTKSNQNDTQWSKYQPFLKTFVSCRPLTDELNQGLEEIKRTVHKNELLVEYISPRGDIYRTSQEYFEQVQDLKNISFYESENSQKGTNAEWYRWTPMIGWVRCSSLSKAQQSALKETKRKNKRNEITIEYEDSNRVGYQVVFKKDNLKKISIAPSLNGMTKDRVQTNAEWYRWTPMIGWVRCSSLSKAQQSALKETKRRNKRNEITIEYEDANRVGYQAVFKNDNLKKISIDPSSNGMIKDRVQTNAKWYKWTPMIGWVRCSSLSNEQQENLKETKRKNKRNEVSIEYEGFNGQYLKEIPKYL